MTSVENSLIEMRHKTIRSRLNSIIASMEKSIVMHLTPRIINIPIYYLFILIYYSYVRDFLVLNCWTSLGLLDSAFHKPYKFYDFRQRALVV